MGRFRLPQKPGSPYITETGFQRLKAELDELWRVKRPEVTRIVSAAAAQGDRSENADYIYGKKQLAEIDRRVRYLKKRLESLIIVRDTPENRYQVYFGAWVQLRDQQGKEVTYRLVGCDEIDASSEYISIDAPLAKALLKKNVNDEIIVDLPKGTERFIIVDVQYQ